MERKGQMGFSDLSKHAKMSNIRKLGDNPCLHKMRLLIWLFIRQEDIKYV